MNTILKKLTSFCGLTLRRKWLVLFVVNLSFYSWLMMRFFKQYARFGGEHRRAATENEQLITDIRWAIFVANKYVCWENVCRHQAYQAKLLCQFYGVRYQVFVGFKKNAESGHIEGHAWTMAGQEMITGFCNPAEYAVQKIHEG